MSRLFEAKPFVIAEVGSNWTTFDHCLQSIAHAKACGADAVKFQLFDEVALYGFGYQVPTYGAPSRPPFLPPAWLPRLAEEAKANKIEFMCTAFSPELVGLVDPWVEVHKVASSDLSYPQLLTAIAKTGKPVLLSTGASSRGDIQMALDHLQGCLVVLMYCVSAYPARTTNLQVLETLKDWFEVEHIGFSDHSIDIINAPLMAAKWGVTAIEKHFTAFPDLDTPDRPHSLTPDEFRLMVEHIRGTRPNGLGSIEEKAMYLRHRRRLIATKDLEAGTSVLLYGQTYGAYRSLVDDTRGLSPFAWRDVEGEISQRDIKRGESIGPEDFGEAF